jgi:hypothetical protein
MDRKLSLTDRIRPFMSNSTTAWDREMAASLAADSIIPWLSMVALGDEGSGLLIFPDFSKSVQPQIAGITEQTVNTAR